MSEIDAILADAPAVTTGPADLARRQSAVERLVALPADAGETLAELAERYLEDLGPSSERLTIVLDAMRKRGQPFAQYAARALTAPGGAEREPYVELLEYDAPQEAAEPLARAFAAYDEDTDVDGFLRARILQALGNLHAHPETIAEGLGQQDSARVRLSAINALDRLDAREQAPALIERLEQDDDPEVVEAAADLLAKWHHKEAVPSLEALASSDWAQRSPEVRDGTARALARLRS